MMEHLSATALMETGCDRRIALRWHLVVEHCPPVHPDWVLCCEWVIERAIAGDDLDVVAPVPAGCMPRTARWILDALHLGLWVKPDHEAGRTK